MRLTVELTEESLGELVGRVAIELLDDPLFFRRLREKLEGSEVEIAATESPAPVPTRRLDLSAWYRKTYGLSTRVANALELNGILPSELRRLTEAELRKLRSLGPKSIAEIREALARSGIKSKL